MIYPSQRITAPFRVEVMGSFLRPQSLIDAQCRYRAGMISSDELDRIEDIEIERLVMKQYNAGLESVTDGEYRRIHYDFDFYKGLNGLELSTGMGSDNSMSVNVTGRIGFNPEHPFLRHFAFLKSIAPLGVIPRISLPSPAQCYADITDSGKILHFDIYDNIESLKHDIVNTYYDMLMALYWCGCRNVVFDDRTWSVCSSRDDALGLVLSELNNTSVKGIPYDCVISLHTHFPSAGMESWSKRMLGLGNVKSYYLEFDRTEPIYWEMLKFIPADKTVVLELTGSDSSDIKDDMISIISRATKYIPLERLCIGIRCDISSKNQYANEHDFWNKIQLLQEISEIVW